MKRVLFGLLLTLSWRLWAADGDLAPEAASGWNRPAVVTAEQMMVVSAHPLASDAGWRVLQAGGSAMDAAIAVQAMLTLVEPQSSGLGGGAFMLYWDAARQRLQAFDGRETAPRSVDEALFLDDSGQPLNFWQALVGGRAVGVPGVMRMLQQGHDQHGRLHWADLFEDAIQRAREGFEVTPRLHRAIASGINPGLAKTPASRAYFYLADGQPLPIGHRLRNESLARSLEGIAAAGADYLYLGPLAEQIVAAVRQADNPGGLSRDDLAAYRALERAPLCGALAHYQVCSMPPPTSGGVGLLQILALMAPFNPAQMDPRGVAFAHLFTQAGRLAYADRARYLADSDFVEVPLAGLLSADYLAERAQLIDPGQDMGTAVAGELGRQARLSGRSLERPSTSHLVVVDGAGNAVSMTSSIEMAFGSTLMAGGFLLNNQLTDFSFAPLQDGQRVANRVAPGKRPRSSMTPVVVLDSQQRLRLLIGSPGGSRIINYVAQATLAHLLGGLSIQQAVSLPHISNRNGETDLEQGTAAEALLEPLQQLGHQLKVRELNSGLHAIARLPDGRYQSGVDPRREGAARGR